jgi:hypothetical protein
MHRMILLANQSWQDRVQQKFSILSENRGSGVVCYQNDGPLSAKLELAYGQIDGYNRI